MSANTKGGTALIKMIAWMLGWGFVALAHAQGGAVIQGVDNDPQNRIWNCDTNRAKFGDASYDKSRCITFRYAVPPGGVRSATLHLGVTVLEAASDVVAIGVAKPFPSCAWAAGPMPCVGLIGGPLPTGEILDIDLFRFPGLPGTKDPPEAQQAVAAQLNTGVVHVLVQDDTVVHCAQLVLNGGTGQALCARAKPGAAGPVASPGTGAGPGKPPTGNTLPMPPFGTPEPSGGVPGMTIQGGQRRVIANERVTVPIWLIGSQSLANMNVEVYYDTKVVRQEGDIGRGNLLANALVSTNPKVQGVLRAGFAQTSGVNGTGTVLNVPFRAIGQPGQSTRLHLVVTALNTPDGRVPAIYRIPGEITILDKDGRIPGPVVPGGPGTGGPGTGGPGTGGPGTGGPGATAGDCDGDGRLTPIDARCALEMSVQLIPVRITLDMDNSRDVTSRDAVLILQRSVGR